MIKFYLLLLFFIGTELTSYELKVSVKRMMLKIQEIKFIFSVKKFVLNTHMCHILHFLLGSQGWVKEAWCFPVEKLKCTKDSKKVNGIRVQVEPLASKRRRINYFIEMG